MLSKRAFLAFTVSERQSLRHQWLRSGQCARCFHISARRRAEEERKAGNDEGTPHNAPQRGPTRQQRAAMISEEVKMLQRDHPSPSFGEPDPNTLRPPGASKTVDPEAIGENVQGRMGENNPVSREGPEAQGLGRIETEDAAAVNERIEVRGVRSPHSGIEEPVEGGATFIPENEEERTSDDTRLTHAQRSEQTHLSFEPGSLSREELLHKYPVSTIAAANYEAIIDDRIKTVAEPGQQDDIRHAPSLAYKMMRGQLVRFVSQDEKAAVEEEAKRIAERWAQNIARRKKLGDGDVQPSARNFEFAPLPESVRKTMVEKLVAGKYDADGLLQGKEKHKQPLLDDIEKITLKNSTYLSQDREALLKKVRSLLPIAKSTPQQRQRTK